MILSNISLNTSTTSTPSWTQLVDLIYPANSVYLSVVEDNPAETIGGGWKAITGGAVLGLAGKNDFATQGEYGGSLKISIEQMPAHSHSATKPTTDSYPFVSGRKNWGLNGYNVDHQEFWEEFVNSTGGGQNYLPYHFSVNGWIRSAM